MSRRTKSDRRRLQRKKQIRQKLGWQPADPKLRVVDDPNAPKPETAKEARETALSYRERVYGLTKEQARSQDAATFIGRAFLNNELSLDQKHTAEWFLEAVLQYRNAVQSPGRRRGPSGFADVDSEDYQRYCERAKETFDGIVAVLRERDIESRTTNSLGLLEAAIVRDVENWRQIGEIREALNVLDKWKTGADEKSSCIVPENLKNAQSGSQANCA